jgi:hypothetical protein
MIKRSRQWLIVKYMCMSFLMHSHVDELCRGTDGARAVRMTSPT